MNKLRKDKRIAVIRALVEGCSIRSTVRMTGVAKNTVIKLVVDIGEVCSAYQDRVMRNLTCRRLQLDEIWNYVGAKAKNVPADRKGEFGIGDVWTWTAIDAETKLIPCWLIGSRDSGCAKEFIMDLASRLVNRVQLTTDGHKAYLEGVEAGFGGQVDFAQLIKIYGKDPKEGEEKRYSPPKCNGTKRQKVSGNPDPDHISTSYAERANLTMRMSMRRFTRLTNAFSKKIENHAHAVALHFMYYNFARIHQTLKCTPAMRAGITDHLWSIEEIVDLLENREQKSN